MSKRSHIAEDEDENNSPPATFGDKLQKFTFANSNGTTTLTTRSTRSKTAIQKTRSASPSPQIRKRSKHRGYAPPSRYAHLSGVPDIFAPSLICVFVGTNPGIKTATDGHAYSSPSNLFWRLLHQSGLTPGATKLRPQDDLYLPELYSLGNTNLVSRPTKDQAELSLSEMEDGVPILEEKVFRWKPEAVCIVGKGIWERIYKAKKGEKLGSGFKFGWQEGWRLGSGGGGDAGGWEGARVFVAISTSGLVAGYSPATKLEIMTRLGDWVNERRRERHETAPRGLPADVVEAAAKARLEAHRKLLEEGVTREKEVEQEKDLEQVTEELIKEAPKS